eukprot:6103323-Amphidinium_carterae.1
MHVYIGGAWRTSLDCHVLLSTPMTGINTYGKPFRNCFSGSASPQPIHDSRSSCPGSFFKIRGARIVHHPHARRVTKAYLSNVGALC